MTEPFDDPADAALLARLRAADPAASLPPAAPERVARLLEETMSHDVLTESRETGTRGRGPLTWLVAAAAAVVIAGTAFVLIDRDGDTAQVPEAGPSASTGTPTVTELTVVAEPGRCMVPSADALSGQPVAFDGTVESIDRNVVTLVASHWYAGGPTDLVSVRAPSERLLTLLVGVQFEEGGRYLVAATDSGAVMLCGFSGPYTQQLAALYAEAFAG